MFPPTSRYQGIEIAQLDLGDGRVVPYLRRRFLPQPEQLALLRVYTVVAGDRLDNVAYAVLGDPEQFWRIGDANGAMQPERLTETPGRRLRITMPEGVPGPAAAIGLGAGGPSG